MRDKTALTAAMSTAHDNHTLEIDNAEDSVLTSATKEVSQLIEKLTHEEVRTAVMRLCRALFVSQKHCHICLGKKKPSSGGGNLPLL